jgi:hypothetical protein
MPNLSWTTNIQIGNDAFSVSRQATPVEAYDRIEVDVEPGTTEANPRVVEIQPGAATRLVLLVIRCNSYPQDLSFKASDGAGDSPKVRLTEPQVFAGGGISLFGLDPKLLKFANPGADSTATIHIFVARDATP